MGIREVARLAEVSISTVSNVLNGTKQVSEPLRQRVLAAAQTLHYEASPVAKGLKTGRTQTIAVVVPQINSVFFTAMLRTLQLEAAEEGYTISIFDTQRNPEQEKACLQLLRAQWVDGILLSSCLDLDNPADIQWARELRHWDRGGVPMPIVCLETEIDPGLDAVVVNETQGTLELTRHLLSQGCSRIGYIAAPLQYAMSRNRLGGYRQALELAGKPPDPRLQAEGDFSPISGYHCMRELLQSGAAPDAVLAGNDQMAIGAVRAILDAGIRIPQELAVAGFNDNFPASLIAPPLTTFHTPKEELGAEALGLLLRRLQDPAAEPRTVCLDGHLVIRDSTDPHVHSRWDLNW